MAILIIGGKDFSNVTSYSVSFQDVDSNESTRNEAGVLFRDRLRANVVKISVTYEYLSFEEGNALLQAVSPAQIQVSYLSTLTGTMQSGTFYAGDRSADLLSNEYGLQYWSKIKFNLVEF